MTYKEYDNIFIEESNIPCIKINLMIKNLRMVGWHGWGNEYIPETGEFRNFMNFATGMVTEIGSAHPWGDAIWEEYVIGTGDYIYSTEEDDSFNIWIYEYCISTGEKKNILAFSGEELWSEADFVFLSYLEPHKILVGTNSAYHYYDRIYLLDFTQMTSVFELETTDLDTLTLLYIQEIDGNLMAFAGGVNVNWDSFTVYCKNFTEDGEWILNNHYSERFFAPEGYWYENWQICNNRYLCTTYFTDAIGFPSPPEPGTLQIISFDMKTYSWQDSNICDAFDFYPSQFYQFVYWAEPYYTSGEWGNIMATDMSDGNLYISHYGFSDWAWVPSVNPTHRKYFHLFQFFGVYNPNINLLSPISIHQWLEYETSARDIGLVVPCVYTTPQHAYFSFPDINTLYEKDMSILSTNLPVEGYYINSTCIMDKNIIFYSILDDDRTIQAININGSILQTWDLGETFYNITISAVGNGIVVSTDQNAIEYIRRQFLLT